MPLFDKLDQQMYSKYYAIKCAKNYKNWWRHFEDVGKKYGPSKVVAPLFLAQPVHLFHQKHVSDSKKATTRQRKRHFNNSTSSYDVCRQREYLQRF